MPTYRQLHEQSLKENQPARYAELKLSGRLSAYLDGVQREASEQQRRVVQQLAEQNPYNPVEWKKGPEAWEGWLGRTASELVLDDRVLVPESPKRSEVGHPLAPRRSRSYLVIKTGASASRLPSAS